MRSICFLYVVLLGSSGVFAQTGNPNSQERADVPKETRPLYTGKGTSSARAGQCRSAPTPTMQNFASWSIRVEEQTGGRGGKNFLSLNGDWKALPWAGIEFRSQAGQEWKFTPEWLENGFIRFLLKGGPDRYGSPAGGIELQVAPVCDRDETGYLGLGSRFADRGRGFDEGCPRTSRSAAWVSIASRSTS